MTTSTKLSGAALAPKPPAKGSFPLDHFAECKAFAIAYERCLDENNRVTSKCRKEARAYLECRMERGLMVQESWDKLGMSQDRFSDPQPGNAATHETRKDEGEGFIAGSRIAKRRKERSVQGD
ncbi:Cytochrome c oxidase assembly protein COX19 [Gracilariopsis chorda]|uniref:Cytochrome c oxidase assembly protein COX19 n=1 Tax=Gracilariopsis chorda TaxID=448386 RepID=A0A2V3J480_9FLOR|nr:Cytochrome c oxidase assembly protein COX19 [Gracilariopsis chorda]|eukprot:PXF48180.1 Cytochrome c oxidase assembly protein COX19 [Gracilariopsis chorda]